MGYAFAGAGALDYLPCRYGTARLQFRGPQRDIAGQYIAVLGGTAAYGRFVPMPFADLLERDLGLPVANLACMNAGPDAFLHEPGVMRIAAGARAVVVQVMGAANLSNRYYAVHPRRNDRFLAAHAPLQGLFPRVDFTEFHFTRHLLTSLQRVSPDLFEVVADHLRLLWQQRMTALLAALPVPVVLLWMAPAPPPAPGRRAVLQGASLLVDADMLAQLARHAQACLQVVMPGSVEGMVLMPGQAGLAQGLPGPAAHRMAADRLRPVLQTFLQ